MVCSLPEHVEWFGLFFWSLERSEKSFDSKQKIRGVIHRWGVWALSCSGLARFVQSIFMAEVA